MAASAANSSGRGYRRLLTGELGVPSPAWLALPLAPIPRGRRCGLRAAEEPLALAGVRMAEPAAGTMRWPLEDAPVAWSPELWRVMRRLSLNDAGSTWVASGDTRVVSGGSVAGSAWLAAPSGRADEESLEEHAQPIAVEPPVAVAEFSTSNASNVTSQSNFGLNGSDT